MTVYNFKRRQDNEIQFAIGCYNRFNGKRPGFILMHEDDFLKLKNYILRKTDQVEVINRFEGINIIRTRDIEEGLIVLV